MDSGTGDNSRPSELLPVHLNPSSNGIAQPVTRVKADDTGSSPPEPTYISCPPNARWIPETNTPNFDFRVGSAPDEDAAGAAGSPVLDADPVEAEFEEQSFWYLDPYPETPQRLPPLILGPPGISPAHTLTRSMIRAMPSASRRYCGVSLSPSPPRNTGDLGGDLDDDGDNDNIFPENQNDPSLQRLHTPRVRASPSTSGNTSSGHLRPSRQASHGPIRASRTPRLPSLYTQLLNARSPTSRLANPVASSSAYNTPMTRGEVVRLFRELLRRDLEHIENQWAYIASALLDPNVCAST